MKFSELPLKATPVGNDPVIILNSEDSNSNAVTTINGIKTAVAPDLSSTEKIANKGQANGYAPLDADGKVPSANLSSTLINNTFVIASNSELTGLAADKGDIAICTDPANKSNYILSAEPASVLANWKKLEQAPDSVSTVNSKTGDVSLTTKDVPEDTNLYFTNTRADGRISAQKGVANGIASLGSDGKVPAGQLPAISTNAAGITVDTSQFNKNLSATEDTVQKALDKLDDLVGGGGSSTVQPGYVDAYSTTEYKTNKYHKDGRPIYRKLVDLGAPPNNAAKLVASGITGISEVTMMRGMMYRSIGSLDQVPIPTPIVGYPSIGLEYLKSTNEIFIKTGEDYSSYTAMAFMEYTKTADGTGAIPTTLDDSIYSTDEIPIGKWIDGKKLYRKVVNFGALPNNATKNVAHGIANISGFTSIKGTSKYSGQNTWHPLPDSDPLAGWSAQIGADLTNAYSTTTQDRSAFNVSYIILEYTCTDR